MPIARALSDEAARDIYLSPAGANEMAAEYRVSREIVCQIRRGQTYRGVTKGLPRPPFRERTADGYTALPTVPLRRRHRRIADPNSILLPEFEYILDEVVPRAFSRFIPRDQKIFRLYEQAGWTLAEVGVEVGLSKARVQEIKNKVLRVLNWHVERELRRGGEQDRVSPKTRDAIQRRLVQEGPPRPPKSSYCNRPPKREPSEPPAGAVPPPPGLDPWLHSSWYAATRRRPPRPLR